MVEFTHVTDRANINELHIFHLLTFYKISDRLLESGVVKIGKFSWHLGRAGRDTS
jgi:hypothetical protein